MFFKDGDYLLDHCEMFGMVEDGGTGMETIDSKGRHRAFNETVELHLEFLKYQMKINGNYDEEKLPKYNVVFDECYFIAFWLSGRFPLIPDKKIEQNVKILKL